jgi:aminopeptidase N
MSAGLLPTRVALLATTLALLSHLELSSTQGSFRLPTNLVPSHYEVQVLVKPTPADDFTFDGVVKIDFTCVEDTGTITLHNYLLTVDEPNVVLEVYVHFFFYCT